MNRLSEKGCLGSAERKTGLLCYLKVIQKVASPIYLRSKKFAIAGKTAMAIFCMIDIYQKLVMAVLT